MKIRARHSGRLMILTVAATWLALCFAAGASVHAADAAPPSSTEGSDAVVGAATGPATGGEPTAAQLKFFEEQIRPVLVANCYECHGEEKQKAKLRLDSRGAILAGGETGPAIDLKKTGESLLLIAISHEDEFLTMPPKKKLAAKKIKALRQWVEMGAPWPGASSDAGPQVRSAGGITDKDRAYWFYQPLSRPAPPTPRDESRVRNVIDRFVITRLEERGLSLAPPADRVTLIRRATFDLTGLPPTPAEIDAFLRDDSADAYEKLIDRLLASPRYGERWGRHWLDLVRYADSDGYKVDEYRPHIWRYRDWVIDAINVDMPYDRFVQMQLAGDELFPNDADARVALGYLRLWPYEFNQRNSPQQWDNILDDATKVTGEVFLGMSMGCARCHDHKFDPILQEDYYKLRAFIAPILPDDDLLTGAPAQIAEYEAQMAKWREAAKDVLAKIEAIEKPIIERLEHPAATKFTDELQELLKTPDEKLTPHERQVKYLTNLQLVFEHKKLESKLKGDTKAKWEALHKELKQFDHLKPKPLPPVMSVRDIGPQPPEVTIPHDRKQRNIEPGYPTVIGADDPQIVEVSHIDDTTGRRATLAKWLTSPDNQLAMRVIVNRLWQYHFASGIVPSANDFGRLGEAPSHPQLLDYLATELPRRGFSLKEMHKLIMTSAAYRQASAIEPTDKTRYADPSNRLLWRYPSRRLAAEQIRDAMLLASGELDTTMGGPGVDENSKRRSVYVKFMRNDRPTINQAFDGPDGFTSTAGRTVTTTAPQSLLLINGDFAAARAREMAKRVEKDVDEALSRGTEVKAGGEPASEVSAGDARAADQNLLPADRAEALAHRAYRLAFGRAPQANELRGAVAFLEHQTRMLGQQQLVEANRDEKALREAFAKALPESHGAAEVNVNKGEHFTVADNETLGVSSFTVDAIVYLESLADDAKVRVIAAQWDGGQSSPGWSFGVTSTRSKYDPRNLILQFVGNDKAGKTTYEVVASDLRPQLHRWYHLAASVNLADPSKAGVTFYMRDLSEDGDVESASVEHNVIAGIDSDAALTIGARDKSPGQGWHGLIHRVRLFNAPLSYDELTKQRQPRPFVAGNDSPILADWRFDPGETFAKDATGRGNDLTARGATPWSRDNAAPTPAAARSAAVSTDALADLCHVLLNANEFLYVD